MAVVTHDGQHVAAETLGLVNLKQLAKKPAKPRPKPKRHHTRKPPRDPVARDASHH